VWKEKFFFGGEGGNENTRGVEVNELELMKKFGTTTTTTSAHSVGGGCIRRNR
jgi:hypothetical protein